MRRGELGREVLAFVPGRAVHPVGGGLPPRREPRPGLAVEERAGVDPHVVALAVVLPEGDRRRVGALGLGGVGEEVEGAAQGLDRARGDIGRALRHLDAAEVGGVDEAIGLGPAPVVGGAVGEPVDGGADLRLVDVGLEAADGDRARPVVEPVGVALLHRHPREVVDNGDDAGDRGLLVEHGLGDDVGGEDGRLVGDHRHRLEEPLELDHDVERGGRVGLDRDARLLRLEAEEGESHEILGRRQHVEDEAAVEAGDRHPGGRERRPGHRDGDAGQGAAPDVVDRPVDRSVPLRERRRCRQQYRYCKDG